jgi:hypothetical protein
MRLLLMQVSSSIFYALSDFWYTDWTKLHDSWLHNLYCSFSIVKVKNNKLYNVLMSSYYALELNKYIYSDKTILQKILTSCSLEIMAKLLMAWWTVQGSDWYITLRNADCLDFVHCLILKKNSGRGSFGIDR